MNLEIFSYNARILIKREFCLISPIYSKMLRFKFLFLTEDRENLEFLKNYDDAHLQNLKLKNSKLANLILINTKNFNGETKILIMIMLKL